jgi:hypothetical protein
MNSANRGTCVQARTFSVRVWGFRIEVTCLDRSTRMNIFYIIGVVVVIVVIAGFFGLHV